MESTSFVCEGFDGVTQPWLDHLPKALRGQRLDGVTIIERLSRSSEWDGDCRVWLRARLAFGYGSVVGGVAHRVAYETLVGEVPAGLVVNHMCENPPCINPDHLEAATHRANTLLGSGVSAVRARRVRCPAGHVYDETNTRVSRRNERKCRACDRVRQREKYRAKAAYPATTGV